MIKVNIVINRDYRNSVEIKSFIEQLPDIFETEGKVIYDKRNVIKSYQLGNRNEELIEIIVKRYKRLRLFQRIIYTFFRSSKARRAFYNASELIKRGIDTPQEIAFIEQKRGGLLEYGYYISKSDYAPPIKDELIIPENFNRNMAKDFAFFVAELHKKGILHHDLNSTNILYHETRDNHYTFSLIDINRMNFYPEGQYPSINVCFDNLTRFSDHTDLFEYVIQQYCNARGLDNSYVTQAFRIKKKHDERWERKKAFFRKFK